MTDVGSAIVCDLRSYLRSASEADNRELTEVGAYRMDREAGRYTGVYGSL